MYSLIQLRRLVPFVLVCLALLPRIYAQDSPRSGAKSHDKSHQVRASVAARERPVAPEARSLGHEETPLVVPPDGVYGGSTAEGYQALFTLPDMNGSQFDTGIGWRSGYTISTGSFNTGVGAGTLALSNANENTATGAGALLLDTSGGRNTANGAFALFWNNTSVRNTAVGDRALQNNDRAHPAGGADFNDAIGVQALFSNVTGFSNNALGDSALLSNVNGAANTAVGDFALGNNDIGGPSPTTANFNTAVGATALFNNSTGGSNNAIGANALFSNTVGAFNEAMGVDALFGNTTADGNVAVGDFAMPFTATSQFCTMIGWNVGQNLADFSSDDIYIGATADSALPPGTAEIGTIRIGDPNFVFDCYVAGIDFSPFGVGVPVPVFVTPDGKLANPASSRRFKHDIKPMDKASEVLLALKPVTFHYKSDAKNIPYFGLIAEEVAEVSPDLVVPDKEGKPYSVRYEQIDAMLLNEFIKEHRTVQDLKATAEKQQATIASQEGQIRALTASLREQAAQIQKVSAQVEMIKPTPQVVENR